MRNTITLIFFLLIILSCKQKQTEYTNDENNSELSGIVESETEKVTESKAENLITEKITNCNLRTLVEINSLLEKGTELNDQNFAVFFANMNSDCKNNAEYSEFNNELIFKTLESNPKKFVAFLSRVSRKIRSKERSDFVLDELRNPISDLIDLPKLQLDLKNTQTEDEELKFEILNSLKIAEQKEK